MNSLFQSILLIVSILFFCFILNMVINKKLDLKYTLTWIFASVIFIILSLFPKLLKYISQILHIVEPVNALFLMVLFFVILIIFTMTLALSNMANKVSSLTQEIGIIKFEREKERQGDKN